MFFPLIHQPDAMDCGPACLGMIAKHYGKAYNIANLRANSYIGRDGVSLLGISRAAENIGFKTIGGRIRFDKLAEKAVIPNGGEIAEVGSHEELTKKRGKYYELVKNQLELGN